MNQPLILVFTIFNPSTGEYLHAFGLNPFRPPSGPKAISFRQPFNSLAEIPGAAHAEIDLILIDEKNLPGEEGWQLIRHLAALRGSCHAILHNQELAGILRSRLQPFLREPVLRKPHNTGPVFDFLTQLAEAWQKREAERYQKLILAFAQRFEIEIELEARLEMLNAYTCPADFEGLLQGRARQITTGMYIRQLLNHNSDILDAVRLLARPGDENFYAALGRLRSLLFPDSLPVE